MVLRAEAVHKDYPRAGKNSNVITAVYPLDFEVDSGKLFEITGRSGSGKSTLLNMLAGMLTPTSGKVLLNDTDLYALDEETLSRLRNEKIGLITQGHTALQSLTILENVLLPSILYKDKRQSGAGEPSLRSGGDSPEDRANMLLEKVGIADLAGARPNELSGGELRRMAVARALFMRPAVVLADEPTAGLDEENTNAVLQLLRDAADEGAAVLLVPHETAASRFADQVYIMDGGKMTLQSRT